MRSSAASRSTARRTLPVVALVLLAACSPGERSPAADAAPADSAAAAGAPAAAVPTVEALVDSGLRAFRAELPEVTTVVGGATGREALVERFFRAAAARDTAALGRLLVTPAEFAWLYFPHTRLAKPPYGIDPGFLWVQMRSNTARDLPRAFDAIGSVGAYAGHTCPGDAAVEGPNRVHERCRVIVRRGSGRDTLSLFGSILERDGRLKFLSYANGL